MNDQQSELWTHASTQMDPLADQTIASVFEEGAVDRLNELFRHLHGADDCSGFSPEVDAYLERSAELPDWYDEEKVKAGEQLFFDYGFVSVLILWAASLPECYRMPEEARVLTTAGPLIRTPEARIRKTARFVFPVMTRGGIRPGGAGVASVQKVRLIHAAIRHLLLKTEPQGGATAASGDSGIAQRLLKAPWDPNKLGAPINQRQLAYTLLTFSHVMLQGYERLGIHIPEKQREGYIHLWNVVGHVLGIDRPLMAENPQEAARLFDLLQSEFARVTPEGKALTSSTLGALEATIPPPLRGNLGPAVAEKILGKQAAAQLGIERKGGLISRGSTAALLALVGAADEIGSLLRISLMGRIAEALGRHVLKGALEAEVHDPSYALQVPEELLGSWKLR